MSYSIIGGADGPTSVFLAGKVGTDWFDLFGLITIVLMLLPNLIYAIHFRGMKDRSVHKGMKILEQVGRYASMFFMIFHTGLGEFNVYFPEAFLLYGIGTILLLIACWVIWMLYFIKQDSWKCIVLAVIPTIIFILNGLARGDGLLLVSGVLFGIGHIYVTYRNTKE